MALVSVFAGLITVDDSTKVFNLAVCTLFLVVILSFDVNVVRKQTYMSLGLAARENILDRRDFLQQGDAEIAAICLSYLSSDDFASAVCKLEESLDNRLQKHPFLD